MMATTLTRISEFQSVCEVGNNFRHGVQYVFHILVTHTMKHRQADQPFVCCLGYRKLSAFVAKALTIIRMVMDGNVVNVDPDVFCTQGPEYSAAIGAELWQIDSNRIEMPRRIDVLANTRNDHSRKLAEHCRIPFGNLPAPGEIRIQFLNLLQAERASDICQSVVKAEQYHFVM